ncbi:MAG: glycosyltransferase family 2 protein [Leptospirales bacterium]
MNTIVIKPELSVIIPVYKAEDTLAEALNSIGKTEYNIEIIVIVDDNEDYSFAEKIDSRVKIISTGATGSGAGRARNKGVAVARSPYLAYLDADDTWSENYLNTLLPIARKNGCAFAATLIINHQGKEILKMPGDSKDQLVPSDFGYWGASFHSVHSSELSLGTSDGPFWHTPSQDVMHSIEVLLACGSSTNLAPDVCYRLKLREDSYSTTKDFNNQLRSSYLQYEDALKNTEAEGVFSAKLQLNGRYVAEAKHDESFYEFVASIRT